MKKITPLWLKEYNNMRIHLTILLWISLIIAIPQLAFGQLTIELINLPAYTPVEDTIYIAGTFNDWSANDTAYIFRKNSNGIPSIKFNPPVGQLKFKITRGSWDKVESNGRGGFIPDHIFEYTGAAVTLQGTVLGWEDLDSGNNSTAAENVRILKNDFFIPQLNRNRKIWIYLPPDYDQSTKNYPVLYLHDGQNVFDASTSFSGEWQVDESLNKLFQQGDYGIIAVAIDNGGADRINEYTPWRNEQYGGGEGSDYIDFITETLKPHIDNNFRTLTAPQHTGIMGSSLGGLISHYGALKFQDVFGKVGVFSPAFWINPEVFDFTENQGKNGDLKIYLLGGEQESATLISELNQMQTTLQNIGFEADQIRLKIDADGQHSEWYWAREFPEAYQWLFNTSEIVDIEAPSLPQIQLKIGPNPATDTLFINNLSADTKYWLKVFSLDGKHLWSKRLKTDVIDISSLKSGTYLFNVYQKKNLLDSQKIVVQP